MGQESGSGLAGAFWLTVSHKESADPQTPEGPLGLEDPLPGSHMWLLAGGFSSSLRVPLRRATHDVAVSFPWSR